MSATNPTAVYERSEVPTGRLGMWWFLGSEIAIFGGLIACYILLRVRHLEWQHEAAHMLRNVGLLNTIVLLTGSLFVVRAHHAAEHGDGQRAARQLLYTLLLGAAFLVNKGFEYHHEIEAGRVPTASLFWGFYFLMTGLHALHVIVGMLIIGVVRAAAQRGQMLHRVELAGLYWHFVDIIWIFLFPLLYMSS